MQDLRRKIDFSNPGHLKLCLLSEGISIRDKNVFNIEKFAENQFPYGYSSISIKKINKTPSELILPPKVVVGLHLKKSSPWSLTYDTKTRKIYLTFSNKKITQVWFNPKPFFYGKRLTNGIQAEKIGIMYGPHILSFFTQGWCYYFIKNLQCKFCSLAPTRKTIGRKNIKTPSSEMIAEVAKLAFKLDSKRIFYLNYCSGSHKDNDKGIFLQLKILKTLQNIIPKNIKHHMLTMPPDDFTLLKKLRKAGLDSLNFAIEVFSPDIFKKICPGKEQFYGYDKFLQAYKEGVKIFGKGKMYVNFVGGLEPLNSAVKGFKYFAKQGIVPSVNIFHPDPESELAQKPPPSVDYLLKLARAQTKIYKNYHFNPIFPKGGTRNSIDTEVYQGFFD